MRVWLDDIRKMPEGYDVWVKTVDTAIELIDKGIVTHISLDNDLGEDKEVGYFVACYIENLAYHKAIPKLTWAVHTMNPVARKVMTQALENADKFWSK